MVALLALKHVSTYSCRSTVVPCCGVKCGLWCGAGKNGVVWCVVVVLSVARCVVFFCAECSITLTLSEQTWRHHLSIFKRDMVTPAVCPRLFEILHHVDFRSSSAENHFVSTAFETIAEENTETRKARCPHAIRQLIVNCQEHNRSWKGSASVLASMRWLLWCEKRDATPMTVPKFLFKGSVLVHKSLRRVFISITVLTNSKNNI